MIPKKSGAGSTPQQDKDTYIGALEKELQDLKKQVQMLTELAARAQADLQNAKGRIERDAEDLRRFAAEGVLRHFLPTIDNFQRALQHLPFALSEHEWAKGIRAIEQELLRQAGELGLKKFSPLSQKIDLSRHEVLLTGPGGADTVIDVLEDGYELHGKVLRPAKVKAGDGSAPASSAPPAESGTPPGH